MEYLGGAWGVRADYWTSEALIELRVDGLPAGELERCLAAARRQSKLCYNDKMRNFSKHIFARHFNLPPTQHTLKRHTRVLKIVP